MLISFLHQREDPFFFTWLLRGYFVKSYYEIKCHFNKSFYYLRYALRRSIRKKVVLLKLDRFCFKSTLSWVIWGGKTPLQSYTVWLQFSVTVVLGLWFIKLPRTSYSYCYALFDISYCLERLMWTSEES